MTSRSLLGLLLAILWLPHTTMGQESFTATRRDEVGFRELDFDEETFLNLLSFEQPLETLQPWLRIDNGFRTSLGSTDAEQFTMDQDLKLYAPLSERVGVRVYARQGIDFDTSFLFFQIAPEFKLDEHFYASIPLNLSPDKGDSDGGLAFGYRNPDVGIDFIQIDWIRSDVFFNDRSQAFMESRISTPADNLELQLQASLCDSDTLSFRIAKQLPSRVSVLEEEREDSFERISGRLLYRHSWSEVDQSYVLFDFDCDDEQSLTIEGARTLLFESERDFHRIQLEHYHYLDEVPASRRWKLGAQFLFFEEHAESLDRSDDVIRREATLYAGYRQPVSWLFGADLEGVIYAGRVDSQSRYPNDPERDGSVPLFQSKLSVSMRWALDDRAEFVLTPTMGLDRIAWGGGGAQLRIRF